MSVTRSSTRTSLSSAEATSRIHRSQSSVKSWVQGPGKVRLDAIADALERNIDPGRATRIVACTTRTATVLTVVLTFVKVAVFLRTGAAVVKTAALDSVGDLLANIITLYTGCRMAEVDLRAFPVGQNRFESIGVLVFSLVMAAMMSQNALCNVESLLDVQVKAREDAVMDFWTALFATKTTVDGGSMWGDPEPGFENFRHAIADTSGLSSLLQTALAAGDGFQSATGAIQHRIDLVSEVLSDHMAKDRLVFQNCFLALFVVHKLSVWMFCSCYAIPRSGSTVLQALAYDNRNDCIATSFAILCTSLGFFAREDINAVVLNGADKVDPLVSLILTCVIIYTWASLAIEQIMNLNMCAVEPEIHDSLRGTVQDSLCECGDAFGFDVRAYYSSSKYTVEVDLHVDQPQVPFSKLQETMQTMTDTICESDQVERAIITPMLVYLP